MIEVGTPDQSLQDQWYCTTALLALFGDQRTHTQCVEASKRLVDAGITRHQIKQLGAKLKTLNGPEERFLYQMNKRGFAIEQMAAFLDAPTQAASFAEKTRNQIMEDVSREWKSMPAALIGAVSSRSSAASSLIVLAGVVACGATLAYGTSVGNQDIQDTAVETAKLFPSLVVHMMESAAGQLLGAGLVLALGSVGLKMGKKVLESSSASSKARLVRLESALTQTLPDGASDHLGNYDNTQARLDEITVAHRNLLTHLSGHELRIFLHGGDRLREEILTARPPSYSQRVACIQAMDVNFFSKFAHQLVLAGSTWEGVLAQGPATLKEGLAAMRQKKLAAPEGSGMTMATAGRAPGLP